MHVRTCGIPQVLPWFFNHRRRPRIFNGFIDRRSQELEIGVTYWALGASQESFAKMFEAPQKVIFLRNLRMSETRRFERPRSSRSQHSNPGGASCLFKASVAQIADAAMI